MALIAYYIGGSVDLSKQVLDRRTPEREIFVYAPHRVGDNKIVRERYICKGDLAPFLRDTFVYVYADKEEIKCSS